MVKIPYEDTILHGYFYRAAHNEGGDSVCPTMVLHNGFDGPAEEMHSQRRRRRSRARLPRAHLRRARSPAARHLDGLVFRPDWENVVTPVLDWVMARPEVDESRVGLLGLSTGGPACPSRRRLRAPPRRLRAVDGVTSSEPPS